MYFPGDGSDYIRYGDHACRRDLVPFYMGYDSEIGSVRKDDKDRWVLAGNDHGNVYFISV